MRGLQKNDLEKDQYDDATNTRKYNIAIIVYADIVKKNM